MKWMATVMHLPFREWKRACEAARALVEHLYSPTRCSLSRYSVLASPCSPSLYHPAPRMHSNYTGMLSGVRLSAESVSWRRLLHLVSYVLKVPSSVHLYVSSPQSRLSALSFRLDGWVSPAVLLPSLSASLSAFLFFALFNTLLFHLPNDPRPARL